MWKEEKREIQARRSHLGITLGNLLVFNIIRVWGRPALVSRYGIIFITIIDILFFFSDFDTI